MKSLKSTKLVVLLVSVMLLVTVAVCVSASADKDLKKCLRNNNIDVRL